MDTCQLTDIHQYAATERRRRPPQIISLAAPWMALVIALTACGRQGMESQVSATRADRQGPSRVTGRVTASDTSEPVPYVQVVFFDLEGNQVGPPGNTDLSGYYAVELPPGRYHGVANIVNPSHPLGWNGLSPAWTGGRPVKSAQGVIEVRAEENKTIDFTLARLRKCTGRVRAEGASAIPPGSTLAVLDAATGEHFAQVSIDTSGAYEILVPDGEWSLAVTVPGFVQKTVSKVVVYGGPANFPEQAVIPVY